MRPGPEPSPPRFSVTLILSHSSEPGCPISNGDSNSCLPELLRVLEG